MLIPLINLYHTFDSLLPEVKLEVNSCIKTVSLVG